MLESTNSTRKDGTGNGLGTLMEYHRSHSNNTASAEGWGSLQLCYGNTDFKNTSRLLFEQTLTNNKFCGI